MMRSAYRGIRFACVVVDRTGARAVMLVACGFVLPVSARAVLSVFARSRPAPDGIVTSVAAEKFSSYSLAGRLRRGVLSVQQDVDHQNPCRRAEDVPVHTEADAAVDVPYNGAVLIDEKGTE